MKKSPLPSPAPSPKKAWATGKNPSMKRRCEQHDYCERGIYMITIATEGRHPLFGTLEAVPAPHVVLSPLGERVNQCWLSIPRFHPVVEPLKLCIMPDHIHGILFVHERMNKHLGHVVNGFKAGCRKAARELGLIAAAMPQPTQPSAPVPSPAPSVVPPASSVPSPAPVVPPASAVPPPAASSVPPASAVLYAAALPQPSPSPSHPVHGLLWEPGYNDRILFHRGQLDRMLAYLDDNPRRLLLKRQHPEYFCRLGTLVVAGVSMQAIGNRFLLDNPVKLQVQCSRSLTPTEIEQRKATFLSAGHEGAILVSPCISPGEQQIATAAMAEKIPLIVLLLNGLPPLYKPQPRYLEACAEGRLLILAPFPYQNEKLTDMRKRCLHLNALAAEISKNQ